MHNLLNWMARVSMGTGYSSKIATTNNEYHPHFHKPRELLFLVKVFDLTRYLLFNRRLYSLARDIGHLTERRIPLKTQRTSYN